MKALVTGGAGFIGSNIVDRLINDGHEVVVIDNESADCNEQFYWNDEAWNYKYDICDFERIKPLFVGVDAVFHLAAEARIQPAILNPIKAVMTNAVGTCSVLQAARLSGVKRVVYSSTSSAYGLINVPPLVETMSRDCLNPYSVSKCAGEDLCKMYSDLYGLETVIFRYFNVYGDRHPTKGQYAPVVGLFIEQYLAGEPMTVVGTGQQLRDYTSVVDVVQANILASNTSNKKPVGQIINVGTGTNHSVLDLVEMIGGSHVFIPPRPGEADTTLADNNRARSLLGWKPTILIENWIKEELCRLKK